ncbi:biotin holocarboxylase synthetase [Blyttiomyces sp. JEL0837]|nr:biotin holocarboxylase synthetase [Blyttiomyces sp. JEL0837]
MRKSIAKKIFPPVSYKRLMNVLVFNGPGVAQGSFTLLLRNIRKVLSSSYDVIPVDANVLLREPWQASTSLLVFPGGRDLPYLEGLSPKGTSIIRSWVQGGGKYLGICAGAYFASSRVEFEVGGSLEVVGPRDLALYKGTAKGSVTSKFSYNDDSPGHLVKVALASGSWLSNAVGKESVHLYCNGGPFFEHADSDQGEAVSILATYQDNVVPDAVGKPAIIECASGLGRTLLVGPHIEFDLFAATSVPNSPVSLKDGETTRQRLLHHLLQHLGLTVNPDSVASDSVSDPVHSNMFLSHAETAHDYASTWISDLIKRCKPSTNTSFPDSWSLVDSVHEINIHQGFGDCDSIRSTNEKDINIFYNADGIPPPIFNTPQFNMSLFFDNLKSAGAERGLRGNDATFGSILLYGEVVGSTQTLLEKNAKFSQKLPHGLVCVGTHQFAGRGRGRNSWISQTGCLQFSLSIQHRHGSSAVFLQYLFGLAVVEAIKTAPGFEDIPIHLKWPNDIYCYHTDETGSKVLRKIGGILVNSSYMNGQFSIVIGCGLNVTNPRPTLSIRDLIVEHNAKLPEAKRLRILSSEEVLARILTQFNILYNRLSSHVLEQPSSPPFEPFLESYCKCWLHGGQEVTLETAGNIKARIVGIDEWGLLKAVTDSGEMYFLQPDGNSFDMMKGLITQKKV